VAGAISAALLGCGATPPGSLVGESAHFRLFVDPALAPPAALAGQNGLDALETAWADAQTLLQMPAGKIDYYWVTQDHVPGACGSVDEGACTDEASLRVIAPTLPNAHELTHAFMYLRKQRHPIPFLAEGIAEAFSCDAQVTSYVDDVPWPEVVASLPSWTEVYAQGGAFARHLIRRFGIEAFLSYYEQSPERRDPALFGGNFLSFWGTTVDDVWAEIHDPSGNGIASGDMKICPCSLPPLAASGAVANDPARAPYWTLPALPAGQSLALTAAFGERVRVQDCDGVRAPLTGQGVIARLDATVARRYVVGPLESAAAGSYLAEDCADAASYTITPAFQGGAGLQIAVPAAPSATVYLALTTTFGWSVRTGDLQEICDSCGFDQGACQPLTAGAAVTAGQSFWARTTLYPRLIDATADVISADVVIRP
jgi:hypothetical protein